MGVGIKMGQPYFQAKQLIDAHGVTVFSSNYTLFGDMSRRVMDTLASFTPHIEIYSIDEAFLDLSGFVGRDVTRYAKAICNTVKQWTGIPVSIGIAPTKTLAKLANRVAKRSPIHNGVLDLSSVDDLQGLMTAVPVGKLWGVSDAFARRLKKLGVLTAWDLRRVDPSRIQQIMGIVGKRMVYELRGVSCLPLEHCPPPKKTIASTRSFGRPVENLDELKEAVATFASRAAQKLRRQYCAASLLTIFINTNRFKPEEPQHRRSASTALLVPTNDTTELIHLAIKLTGAIYQKGYRYKQAGVMLDGLTNAQRVQPTLFDRTDRIRRSRLMNVMDHINTKMGTGTLRSAATGQHRLPAQRQPHWHTRCGYRSRRYTTKWDELAAAVTC